MKRILITGGLGFVGSRIAEHLSLDSNNYLRLGSSQKNKAAPLWLKNGEVVYCNMQDPASLEQVTTDVDIIIHLAAANEVVCSQNPELAFQINTVGSFNLVRMAIKNKVSRVIYFSTAHVYGAPLIGHIDETLPTFPVHPYSYTHRAVEDYVLTGHRNKDFVGVVLRLSNSFGRPAYAESQRWSLLVNDLCMQAVKEKSLTIKSTTNQERDFICLEDVARASAFFARVDDKKLGNGLFNLGGNNVLTILEVAQLIRVRAEQILGERVILKLPNGFRADTPRPSMKYDIEKMLALGFFLTASAENEIDGMIKYCREYQ